MMGESSRDESMVVKRTTRLSPPRAEAGATKVKASTILPGSMLLSVRRVVR